MDIRNIAIIAHVDHGKTTLVDQLLKQSGSFRENQAVAERAMDSNDIERERGITILAKATSVEWKGTRINIVDTPGHADFSEDTYRVLSAVDCAVMLIDAAKGLESQTMKLFEVCAHRNIPIITVVNKWDRPGLDALALMDEVQQRTGLLPTPITWPVGQSGDFRGVLDRITGEYTKYTRTDGGATIAGEETFAPEAAAELEGEAWTTAVDESELLDMEDQNHDQETFLAGKSTPVMFASAVLNFGIHKLLDTLVDLAPAAEAREDKESAPRDVAAPFSGFVFKVQAGMDSNHRDRLAYIRVCSGVFERGSVLTHSATGKPFATKYAQQVFGRDRDVVDEAFPGDVVGLVNASALRVGDSLYLDKKVEFPGIPTFSPEHFMVIRAKDSSKYKQFRRGIEQLDHEGVIQVLRSDLRGDQAPVLGAVGPMQFEVAEDRMTNEFNAPCSLERLNFSLARRTTPECVPTLARERNVEVLSRSDGELLALFSDRWRLQGVEKNHPDLVLEPLVVS